MNINTVKKAAPNTSAMGHRIGTCAAPTDDLFAKFGAPTHDWRGDPCDGKVTLSWVFKTPRGNAEIRDYWWNAEGEWTIAASNRKAAMHLAQHLRNNGIPASSKFYRLADVRQFN